MANQIPQYETAVHEQHRGEKSHLPFAISMRRLAERVRKHKPDVEIRSTEWMRL